MLILMTKYAIYVMIHTQASITETNQHPLFYSIYTTTCSCVMRHKGKRKIQMARSGGRGGVGSRRK
jgi:uncharacterized membrane protein YhfC